MTEPYTHRQSGTTGCEIIDADGRVFAWTVDAGSAGLIVGLLNQAAPFQSPTEKLIMTKEEVKNLVQTLLKHRPDLVIVITENE